jgi:TonB-linked SusC/RagA family outer membrane protein
MSRSPFAKRNFSLALTICVWVGLVCAQFAAFAKENKYNPAGVNTEGNQQKPGIKITGTVKDKLSKPIPLVTVKEVGSAQATVTDENGRFSITVDPKSLIEFSHVNYKTQVISVNNIIEWDIIMDAVEGNLNEVVVVGYGKQRKISQVGAQSNINVEELKLPVANLSTVLGGRISGVVSVQRSGEPGRDNADVWIRGISTFGGNNSRPLVIIDGVPRGEGILTGNTLDALRNIDPEDIESFSILKDASATAVYGVRGANGVIIVNTKSGKAGKPKFNFSYNEGVTTFTRLPDMADGVTYMNLANEARRTRGQVDQYIQDKIDRTASGEDPLLYPNVDWFKQIFNTWGHNRRANMNIRGGSPTANYYISTGYYDETGFLKTDELAKYNSDIKYTRYNFTSNLNIQATSSTSFEVGVQGWIANGNYSGRSADFVFQQALQLPAISFPVSYPGDKMGGVSPNGDQRNPWADVTQTGYRNEFSNQLYSNLRVKQTFDFWVKGLSINGLFSFDAINRHNIDRTKDYDTWLATGRDSLGNLILNPVLTTTNKFLGYTRTNGGNRQFYAEASANYDNSFGKHRVSGLLLYNQRDLVDGFATDLTSSIPYRSRGIAGRTTYSYDDRYFGEFNFGYNGSENFIPSKRFGFFPSAGIGWVASNEKFYAPLKNIFQFFKIRGSYGLVGNGTLAGRRFAYTAQLNENTGTYTFGINRDNNSFAPGIDIAEYASNVTWEKSRKANIGFELRTFNSALSLQVDFFKEWREGIFLRRQDAPLFMGLRSSPFGNLGAAENKGIDATAEYNKRFGEFNVAFRGTFTYNHDKVTENGQPAPKYSWMPGRTGDKILQRYGYIALGYFIDDHDVMSNPHHINDKPGDIKYADLNNDGVINSDDVTKTGLGDVPEIVYGAGFNINYKNFNLSTFFQGIGRVDIEVNGNGFIPFSQGFFGALYSKATDRWTPDNPNAFYPRLSYGVVNDNYKPSTWWVKKGSYVRMRSLEFGYSLPGKIYERVGLKMARIYFEGTNLLTFSKFKLWDVELGTNNGGRYPEVKTFSLGVNFQF